MMTSVKAGACGGHPIRALSPPLKCFLRERERERERDGVGTSSSHIKARP